MDLDMDSEEGVQVSDSGRVTRGSRRGRQRILDQAFPRGVFDALLMVQRSSLERPLLVEIAPRGLPSTVVLAALSRSRAPQPSLDHFSASASPLVMLTRDDLEGSCGSPTQCTPERRPDEPFPNVSGLETDRRTMFTYILCRYPVGTYPTLEGEMAIHGTT